MQEYIYGLLLQQQEPLSVVASALSAISTECLDISQLEICVDAQIALAHARDLCDVALNALQNRTDS
nr:hypothetical protein [Lachnoclostridium phocaeense]